MSAASSDGTRNIHVRIVVALGLLVLATLVLRVPQAWPLALVPAVMTATLGSRSHALRGGAVCALLLILAILGSTGGAVEIAIAGVSMGAILWVVTLERARMTRTLARTAESSMTDRLTGLYNFSYFKDQIRRECRRAARDGRDLSLVLIDIDHFKAFNDTHGHASGNHLLAAVAAEIANCTRDGDCAARYGGEEFAVIVDGDGDAARALAERINRNVAAIRATTTGGRVVSTTVSCGVAIWHDTTQEELIEEADRALYAAKAAGRNRVECYATTA